MTLTATQPCAGQTAKASLSEPTPGHMVEIVMLGAKTLHLAAFPASQLGTADRKAYLRTMLASIVTRHERGLTPASTL